MRRKGIYLALVSVLVAGCGESKPPAYYPVARTSMPGGYSLVAIQPPVAKEACELANTRYLAPVKACAECKIDYSGCDASLAGAEKKMMAGEPVAQYSILAAPLHLLINGPDGISKEVCGQMAAELGKKGTAANCVSPGAKP